MTPTLFPAETALSDLVALSGTYVGVGVGVALSFYMLGHVVYFIIDAVRGVI